MEPWHRLDRAAPDEARRLLRTCCGSSRWVDRMMARRPYGTRSGLHAAAREEWLSLANEDWLEAFSHHPQIGDRASLAKRFPETAHLSANEQSGVNSAADATLSALASENAAYKEKFGHIFIVCASGQTAEQMLATLRARITNDPATEIRIAAGEQAKITELRLDHLSDG
jgi:2-oxo-4-hydroxy-4-carboxy-5-ureidoimidazoline decarboxylase